MGSLMGQNWLCAIAARLKYFCQPYQRSLRWQMLIMA